MILQLLGKILYPTNMVVGLDVSATLTCFECGHTITTQDTNKLEGWEVKSTSQGRFLYCEDCSRSTKEFVNV